jgi:competence protein ComEC
MKSSSRIVSFVVLLKISVTLLLFGSLEGQPFSGFDSASLTPVHNIQGEWGLKIVVLNVGQADAILVIAPNGDVVLIDAGRSNAHGNQIADFLEASQLNGVGNIKTVNLLYSTHYDADHIGGLKQLKARGFAIRKAFDQGLSTARTPVTAAGNRSTYGKYVTAVGDPNNNYQQDPGESDFCRNRIEFGHTESIGQNDLVQIRCVAVRGDTEGTSEDINLDPSQGSINENPGSIALIIRLGDFELYTAGDQTDDDWKHEPEAEEAVIDSGAIHGGNDIDVLKVSHHGSDTSTSDAIAEELDPEVAVISTKFSGAKLPKKTTLKQLEENRCFVLITGDGHDPSTNTFTGSSHSEDDGYTPSTSAVFNNQGNVTILVSPDGSRYTVFGGTFQRTFSAVDQDNHR